MMVNDIVHLAKQNSFLEFYFVHLHVLYIYIYIYVYV